MGIYRIKISELPSSSNLDGLYTIGYTTINGNNVSVKVSLAYLKIAADKVAAAETAAIAANAAAQDANAKAQLAGAKAGEANTAAANANEKAQTAQATINRMEELADNIIAGVKLTPQEMILEYPNVVTIQDKSPHQIKYKLLPENTGNNVLFLGDNNAIAVMPDGSFVAKQSGISRVFIIPTENTSIYKIIEIRVVEAILRKVSLNSLRILGNGNLKFI